MITGRGHPRLKEILGINYTDPILKSILSWGRVA
jgi:hypothetical protein